MVETGTPALKYALVALQDDGLIVGTVAHMLDPQGRSARILARGEGVPLGAMPVLVADTSVYGAVCVELMMRQWDARVPKPWLVWTADAPMAPPPGARYRIRALSSRLAGVSRLPYLPVLRTVATPQEALHDTAVQAAAVKLRRSMGTGTD